MNQIMHLNAALHRGVTCPSLQINLMMHDWYVRCADNAAGAREEDMLDKLLTTLGKHECC